MEDNNEVKICQMCLGEYVPYFKVRDRQKYCSPACRNAIARIKKREQRQREWEQTDKLSSKDFQLVQYVKQEIYEAVGNSPQLENNQTAITEKNSRISINHSGIDFIPGLSKEENNQRLGTITERDLQPVQANDGRIYIPAMEDIRKWKHVENTKKTKRWRRRV